MVTDLKLKWNRINVFLLLSFFFCLVLDVNAQKGQPTNATNMNKPKSKNIIKLAGEPIPGAEIYVELEPDDEPIANLGCNPSLSLTENEDGTVSASISCAELLPPNYNFKFTAKLNLIKLFKILGTENRVTGTVVFEYNNKRKGVNATYIRGAERPLIVATLSGTPSQILIRGSRLNNQLDLESNPKKSTQ